MCALLILLAASFLGGASPEIQQPDKYQLLLPQQYHGKEVTAKSGEKWWGVFQVEEGQELRPVILDIKSVHDGIVDGDKKEDTGKLVSTKEKGRGICLFLVKGLKNATPGPITSFFSGEFRLCPSKYRIEFSTKGEELLTLEVAGTVEDQYIKGEDYSITVRFGKPTELYRESSPHFVFESKTKFNDAVPALLWAGDLDRDGKPDLLLNETYHYNVSLPTLLLSGGAEKGKLLERVAQISSCGC
jgi:hypothetical protein